MPPKSAASEALQQETEQLPPDLGPFAGSASASLPDKASYSTDAAIGSATDILPGSVPHDPNDQEDGTDHRKPSPNSSNASRQDTVAQGLSRNGSQKKATSPADVLESPAEHVALATNSVDAVCHGRQKVAQDDAVGSRDEKAAGEDGSSLHTSVQEPVGDRQNGEAAAMHEQNRIARMLAIGKSEKALHSQSMRFKGLLEAQDSIPYGLFSCAHSVEVSV